VFYVSSAVTLGYLVLPFSGFSLWIRLGMLTATVVTVSALSSLAVVTSLGVVLRPAFLMTKARANHATERAVLLQRADTLESAS